ncbi:ABC transporter permease [Demequina globuliformis]|uniref:ABC transporter permease n=1 Tax=Demequina globuliformis TaxID=676202 RepID=UPI0007858BDD|nr:ABC transporter permease [Demequina globuliformis]
MTTIDYEAIAREAGLERVGARPPLGSYLVSVWRRRAFIYTMARYRLQASVEENRLGLGWIVLKPILNALLYGFIFAVIMPSDTRPDNFIPFLVAGVFVFEYFSKALGMGARAIVGEASLVRSLNFPRMLLPVALITRHAIEMVPMMVVLGIILVVTGEPITFWWLMSIPVLVVMTAFNLGVALTVARLTVHVRDISQLIPLITRLFFYASGIFYSLELVLADQPSWMLRLAQLNPVHDFISLIRGYMVSGNPVNSFMWTVAIVSAVLMLAFGTWFFWRAEERYGHD